MAILTLLFFFFFFFIVAGIWYVICHIIFPVCFAVSLYLFFFFFLLPSWSPNFSFCVCLNYKNKKFHITSIIGAAQESDCACLCKTFSWINDRSLFTLVDDPHFIMAVYMKRNRTSYIFFSVTPTSLCSFFVIIYMCAMVKKLFWYNSGSLIDDESSALWSLRDLRLCLWLAFYWGTKVYIVLVLFSGASSCVLVWKLEISVHMVSLCFTYSLVCTLRTSLALFW